MLGRDRIRVWTLESKLYEFGQEDTQGYRMLTLNGKQFGKVHIFGSGMQLSNQKYRQDFPLQIVPEYQLIIGVIVDGKKQLWFSPIIVDVLLN